MIAIRTDAWSCRTACRTARSSSWDDRIRGIEDEIPQGADRVIDAHGRYVLPGFLDIHSDRIEQSSCPGPRPVRL